MRLEKCFEKLNNFMDSRQWGKDLPLTMRSENELYWVTLGRPGSKMAKIDKDYL